MKRKWSYNNNDDDNNNDITYYNYDDSNNDIIDNNNSTSNNIICGKMFHRNLDPCHEILFENAFLFIEIIS